MINITENSTNMNIEININTTKQLITIEIINHIKMIIIILSVLKPIIDTNNLKLSMLLATVIIKHRKFLIELRLGGISNLKIQICCLLNTKLTFQIRGLGWQDKNQSIKYNKKNNLNIMIVN